MSDEDLARLERAVRERPGDALALERYVRARVRSEDGRRVFLSVFMLPSSWGVLAGGDGLFLGPIVDQPIAVKNETPYAIELEFSGVAREHLDASGEADGRSGELRVIIREAEGPESKWLA